MLMTVTVEGFRDKEHVKCARLTLFLLWLQSDIRVNRSKVSSVACIMTDRSCSPIRSEPQANTRGYSNYIDAEISSVDSALSDSSEDGEIHASRPGSSLSYEDSRRRVSICWENIDVFVEVSRPSFLKRLCFDKKYQGAAKVKQILSNGEQIHTFC